MEITTHSLWTLIHGIGFGALYLLACSGALIELRHWLRADSADSVRVHDRFLGWYLAAMAALSAALRAPLVLREVYGYEYAEIAALLGKPVGTVKAAVHRGRATLVEELGRRRAPEGEGD